MDRCRSCDCWDFYNEQLTMPDYDKWYACLIESEKRENQKALKQWAEELERRKNDKRNPR